MHSSTDPNPPRRAAGAAQRDAARWDALVRRLGGRLAGVVQRHLRRTLGHARPDEVDDLLQEVWCRVFERCRPRLARLWAHSEEQAFAYLARVARNLVVDRVRSECAAKRGGGWRRDQGDPGGADPLDDVIDPGDSPEVRLRAREARRVFRRRCRPHLGRCPAQARRNLFIVERALLAGWSSRQIAHALDGELAPSSIDSLVHRVRRSLAAEGTVLERR